MNITDINGSKYFRVRIDGAIEIKELNKKIAALKELTGSAPEIYIFGHYEDSTGEAIYMDSQERKVLSINNTFLVVDLGAEGKVKIDPYKVLVSFSTKSRLSLECEIK